jgi:protein TonB
MPMLIALLLVLQPGIPAPAASEPVTGASGRLGAGLNRYFSRDDYPPAALRNEEEGIVRFRVAVLPNGRIGACTITASSGSAPLDATTCRILRSRVRYTPARPGAPVAGADLGWVRYVLPPDRPRPPAIESHTVHNWEEMFRPPRH